METKHKPSVQAGRVGRYAATVQSNGEQGTKTSSEKGSSSETLEKGNMPMQTLI